MSEERKRKRRNPLSHEARVTLHALGAALPAALVAIGFLWLEPHSPKVRWTLTLVCIGAWTALALTVREEVARPLQTLSNLLAALREGDFSIRGRHNRSDDALGVALDEANALAATLRRERYGALEASALVRKAIEAIDVAIYVFDADGVLTLTNAAGARLAGVEPNRIAGQRAAALGLEALLDGESPRTLALTLGGVPRQLEVRRGPVRQEGRPSTLVVAADLSRALRAEERHAFERLVRVLGHEINNSLAPIRSIAASLRARAKQPLADDGDFAADLASGLEVIERRAEALGRFMSSYARLMRLPPPRFGAVDVAAVVRRVVELEQRRPIALVEGPALTVRADGDQLEQLLINLVRNAVDAAAEPEGQGTGAVEVTWETRGDTLVVRVRDEGPGLSDTRNLFVPFFTTKATGSGIGLVLSRQIAENHGGTLTLQDRHDRRGCEARLTLPRK
ncbi:MAG TPA: ATP-binding protein [Polyangia bacterium]|nr:ATP-binding protein [Polyangia bacterium]